VDDHLEKNPEVVKKLVYVIERENAWNERKTLIEGEIQASHGDIIKKSTSVNCFTRELRKLEAWLKRIVVAKGIALESAEISEKLKAGTCFPLSIQGCFC
jgi:hypothetical protein